MLRTGFTVDAVLDGEPDTFDFLGFADYDHLTSSERAAKQPHPNRGQHLRLTVWHRVYDWVTDSGYENFESWIQKA